MRLLRVGRLAWLAALASLWVAPVRPALAQDSAARAWKEIEQLQRLIDENLDRDRTDEALLSGQWVLMQVRLEGFVQAYPQDRRAWVARVRLPEVRCRAALGLEQAVQWQAAAAELDKLIEIHELPSSLRAEAELAWIALKQRQEREDALPPGEVEHVSRRMEEFGAKHPRHKQAARLQFELGKLLAPTDPKRAEQALKFALLRGDERVAGKARLQLAVLPYRSAPLDLVFRALDGSKVDLTALRGKVILIDFWATWCGPCREEVPRVLHVYQRYKERGFEIIGISLDHDADTLKDYTTARGMTWPQYFDGLGWETTPCRRFGIGAIPEMWLLDKEGRIVSTEIWGGNLEYHVKAQLAK